MTPTLDEISVNPDLLRLFLINQGLTEEFKEFPSFYFDYKVENEASFLWGHCMKFMVSRGGIYTYKFKNEALFYSIVFPLFNRSEINQLDSLFRFIEDFFYDGSLIEKENSYEISVTKPVITSSNDRFVLLKKSNSDFRLSNKYITVNLKNIEFQTLYSSVLTAFKNKLDNYLDKKDSIITIDVFNSIFNESVPILINRLFNKLSVIPVCNQTFLECFDEQTLSVVSKNNKKLKEFMLDIESDHIFRVDNDIYYHVYFYIDSISVLRSLLKKSMSLEDINFLIQIISMTFFYHNIMNPDNKLIYFSFARYNIFNMNKLRILDEKFFYDLEFGDYSIKLGKDIVMEFTNFIDGSEQSFTVSTMQELYQNQFDFITASICKSLSAEPHNICIRDLKVIEMLLL
jgi:hypothetical protein